MNQRFFFFFDKETLQKEVLDWCPTFEIEKGLSPVGILSVVLYHILSYVISLDIDD